MSFFPASLLIFILISPWFFVFPKQLETGLSAASASPAWAQVVGSPTLKNLALTFVKFTIGRISYDDNLRYVLLFFPIAFYVCILFLISLFRLSKIRSFLYFWLFLPIFLGFLISFYIPAFAYFRFLFVLPAFYIIWAAGINSINWQWPLRTLLFIAIFINLVTTSVYFLFPKFQREDWKSATAYVHQNSDSQTVVLFESTFSMAPFDYYNKDSVQTFGVLDSFNPTEEKVKENIERTTFGKNRVYLFQYLSQITDKNGIAFRQLSSTGFKNVSTRDFTNVGFVYEFIR